MQLVCNTLANLYKAHAHYIDRYRYWHKSLSACSFIGLNVCEVQCCVSSYCCSVLSVPCLWVWLVAMDVGCGWGNNDVVIQHEQYNYAKCNSVMSG